MLAQGPMPRRSPPACRYHPNYSEPCPACSESAKRAKAVSEGWRHLPPGGEGLMPRPELPALRAAVEEPSTEKNPLPVLAPPRMNVEPLTPDHVQAENQRRRVSSGEIPKLAGEHNRGVFFHEPAPATDKPQEQRSGTLEAVLERLEGEDTSERLAAAATARVVTGRIAVLRGAMKTLAEGARVARTEAKQDAILDAMLDLAREVQSLSRAGIKEPGR